MKALSILVLLAVFSAAPVSREAADAQGEFPVPTETSAPVNTIIEEKLPSEFRQPPPEALELPAEPPAPPDAGPAESPDKEPQPQGIDAEQPAETPEQTPQPPESAENEQRAADEEAPELEQPQEETVELPPSPEPPPPPPDAITAITKLRDRVLLHPDDMDARVTLGNRLIEIGDMEAAIDEYRTVLRLYPEHPQAHLNLGTALMLKQDWRNALTELKEAVKLDPSLAQAHYSLATIYYTKGNTSAAIQSYHQVLKLNPDFPEAHYRLGLVLKVANLQREAALELEEAALSGIAKAQYALGNAYKSGQGVDKDLAMAITWWSRAAEQGLPEALQEMTQLRRVAVSTSSKLKRRAEAINEAFKEFTNDLWLDYPDLERKEDSRSVGITLLERGRTAEALRVLLREAYALNEAAQIELVRIYEQGLDGQLDSHGQWILDYLENTASDGVPHSRATLARIYAKGLGVSADHAKAKGYLKGLPKAEAQRIWNELTASVSPDS